MRSVACVVTALAFAACGKPSPAPAPAAPTQAAPEPVKAEPEAPIPKAETPKPETPKAETPKPEARAPRKLGKAKLAKLTDDQKKFKALLNEGRAAVKADDPELGVKKLLEALTYFDADPTALGELGWAAFRAGPAYRERAYEATRAALGSSKKDSQRGALWYNLGRIAEDDGALELALDAYRQSLSYRKNDTVREHLEALVAKLGGKTAREGLAALEDVCAELRGREGCEVVVDAAGTPASPCDCKHELLGPEPGFGRAALVNITGTTEDAGGSLDNTYLAVELAAKWRIVGLVGNDWVPGLGYVHNNSTRHRFAFDAWGEARVLWVDYTNELSDMDPGVYADNTDSERKLTLCTIADAALSCIEVPLGELHDVSAISLDENEDPVDPELLPTPSHSEWELLPSLAGGVLTLQTTKGPLPDALKQLEGKHTWAELTKLAGVRVIEL